MNNEEIDKIREMLDRVLGTILAVTLIVCSSAIILTAIAIYLKK